MWSFGIVGSLRSIGGVGDAFARCGGTADWAAVRHSGDLDGSRKRLVGVDDCLDLGEAHLDDAGGRGDDSSGRHVDVEVDVEVGDDLYEKLGDNRDVQVLAWTSVVGGAELQTVSSWTNRRGCFGRVKYSSVGM